jgi:glycosyltransferase involved in cell wall biosynthesis
MLLQGISRRVECHVLSFAEAPDEKAVNEFLKHCPGVKVLGVFSPRPSTFLTKLQGFLREGLISSGAYDSSWFERILFETLAGTSYDAIHIDMINLAWLASRIKQPNVVLSVNDAVSLGYLRSAKSATSWPQSLRLRLAAAAIRHYERRAYRGQVVHVVSRVDQEYLRSLCPSARVEVVGLAVDPSSFAEPDFQEKAKKIITIPVNFRAPGICKAVLDFMSAFRPLLVGECRDASIQIVGRGANESFLRKISTYPNVKYLGWVDDYSATLREASVGLFLEKNGAGTKNRLLEAMEVGIPLAVTRVVASGVEALDRRHFLVCDTPDDFVSAVKAILSDRALATSLGREAWRFVADNHSVSSVTDKWEVLYRTLAEPPTNDLGPRPVREGVRLTFS